MAAYLDAWLEEAPDDAGGIAMALEDIARAKGMTQVAAPRRASDKRCSAGVSGDR
jgi:DNA-binding phage protein